MEELLWSAGALFGGLFLGALGFSRFGLWAIGVHAALTAKDVGLAQRAANVCLAVVLASGLWVLVAVCIIAVAVRAQPWAAWSYSGLGVAVLYFAALSVYLDRKARKRHAAA